jgi:hypothetical protein
VRPVRRYAAHVLRASFPQVDLRCSLTNAGAPLFIWRAPMLRTYVTFPSRAAEAERVAHVSDTVPNIPGCASPQMRVT